MICSAKTADSPSQARSLFAVLTWYLVSPLFIRSTRGKRLPPHRREFPCPTGRYPQPYLYKETVGSPQFPSYPCECMPCSKTPVVSPDTRHFASQDCCLPNTWTPSAFVHPWMDLSFWPQPLSISGLSHTAYTLAQPSSRLSLRSLPVGFAIGLPAKLWPSGTFPNNSESPTG